VRGVEIKIPHLEVQTSRPYDLATKATMLLLWPYCREEKCGYHVWGLVAALVALIATASSITRLVAAQSEDTCLWEGKW